MLRLAHLLLKLENLENRVTVIYWLQEMGTILIFCMIHKIKAGALFQQQYCVKWKGK